MLEQPGAALDDVGGDRVFPPDEQWPDDLTARVRSVTGDPNHPDHAAVAAVLRSLGWTPPPPPPPLRHRVALPGTGDLLELLAGGCSVHEAADCLGTDMETLREQLVALRRAHACSSTAEVVRRVRQGH